MENVVLGHYILRVEDVGLTDLRRKLGPEFIQRGMGSVVAGFHLDGRDLFPLCDEEVNLHMILPMLIVRPGIEVQFVAVGPQNLSYHIFHQRHLDLDISYTDVL